MIERKFVADNIKEMQIKEYVKNNLGRVGLSDVKVQKTPLGEKIIISASRPGLVVGRSGANIARITKELKQEFKLDNPQIEIEEVKESGSDANIIAELIAGSMERYGSARFKGIGHKAMSDVMNDGALGVEILMSGKIPSSRAKTWRFYKGYLKKCGDISVSGVKNAYAISKLKTGIVGVKVSIMPAEIKLPDQIKLASEMVEVVEEVKGREEKEVKEEIKKETEKEDNSNNSNNSNKSSKSNMSESKEKKSSAKESKSETKTKKEQKKETKEKKTSPKSVKTEKKNEDKGTKSSK